MKPKNNRTPEAVGAQATGPWPFVTRRIHRRADGSLAIWSSRHHRKKLVLPEAVKAVAIAETLLHSLWMPKKLNWWIVFINLLGCVGFMASALFSIVLPGPENAAAATLAVAFTLQGAICFLLGSLLMLPETALESESG